MDKSICKLIIWHKIFAIDYTQSHLVRNACPECLGWSGHTQTKPLYQASSYQMHHQSDLLLWSIFQLMLKNWNGVNLSIIEIYGIGKGWAESKAVEIAAVATLVSASNEWSDPGADISLCQEQLLHVGGHQPGTRGQQLDVTTALWVHLMWWWEISNFANENRLILV